MSARSEVAPASSRAGRPAVYLAPVGWRGSNERTPLLVRLLGLDVWGSSLLNTRARREMMGAAIVLSIVFLFELTTWSVLFNVVVHGAAWAIGARTLLAVTIGGILATAILVFERGIVIADTSSRRWLFGFALAARVGLILVSALATSQPIELLVFGHEIDERLKDEGVRAEAVHQLHQLDEEEAAKQQSIEKRAQEEAETTQAYVDLQAAIANVKAKEEQWSTNPKLAEAKGQRKALEARKESLKSQIDNLERKRDDQDAPKLGELRKSLGVVERGLRGATRTIATEEELNEQKRTPLADARKALEAAQEAFNKVLDALREKFRKESTEAKQSQQARRERMGKLQRSVPGIPVPAQSSRDDDWNPYLAGFVRRHAVLADLLEGRPAAWPAGKDDLRTRAIKEFGIEEVDPGDKEFHDRARIHSQDFRRIYWIAFLVALFVPLLTIAFKIVVGRELRVYYSTKAQARAGNPEAIAVFLADGTSSESWSEPAAA